MPRSLRGAYGLAVAFVLLGLCPELVLSTAFAPMSTVLVSGLHTSLLALQVANGLSNAAFAAGVVFAAQLGLRFLQRRLFLCYISGFVVGSVVAATAATLAPFLLGRVIQGGATGLMEISALPPLITRYGVRRLPWTVGIVNLGLFGAASVGPIVGGAVGGSGDWRMLLWIIAAVGALGLVVAVLGFPALDPLDPEFPVDRAAIWLTCLGTVLIFVATSVLSTTTLSSGWFWAPFLVGLLAVLTLVVLERRREQPLMPARDLSTQLPVTGTMVAMVAGAAYVTTVEIVQTYLTSVAGKQPTSAGLLFWPMPAGLLVAAVVFGLVFRTRYLPLLVVVGLLVMAGGCAILLTLSANGATWPVSVASVLLGFGAGATVSPGLFLAGLGVRSSRIGRAFALVQLLRLTASFAVGPIVLYLVENQSTPMAGIHLGLWITLALSVLGFVLAVAIPALSGARPQTPDLEGWLERGERGLRSPTTGVHLRPGVVDEEAHDLVPPRLRRRR